MLAAKKGLLPCLNSLAAEDTEASEISESFEADHIELHTEKTPQRMESASPPVRFPLLVKGAYDPITFPLRSNRDPPTELTKLERDWIEVFRRSIPSFRARAASDATVEDAEAKADKFAERYGAMLDDFSTDPHSHGGPPDIVLLCRLRELVLRELGLFDIFKTVKYDENVGALGLLPEHLRRVDAISDTAERVDFLVRGVLAGNIFDLGTKSTTDMFEKGEVTFESSFQNLLPRPWAVDDLDQFKAAWTHKAWKKVVIFCDNAGADTILGVLPLAREFLKCGAQVVLAANDLPSINDITYDELLGVLQKIQVSLEDEISVAVDRGSILIVNSGNDLPVVDLSATSPELAFTSDGAELVILVGMGRAIETNLHTQLTCDCLNIGLIKHQEVADYLGGRMYDSVVKYKAVDMPPTPSRRVKQPIPLSE